MNEANNHEFILSVVIPVYNVEQYLSECLDSIYTQSLKNVQVICVNDGSTDNSLKILNTYKERFPEMLIVNRENGGLSAARNSGLRVATGKYIYFLDSDDYLLPDALNKMIAFAEANNLDVANFNVTKSDDSNYFLIKDYPKTVLSGKEFTRALYNIHYYLPEAAVWLYLYKKSFLDENALLFKEGIIHEDNHFTGKVLFFAQRVQLLNVSIQFHRVAREGGLTQRVTKNQITSLLFIARDLYHFYQSHACNEKTFYDKIFLIYINIAARILILKNYGETVFSNEDYTIMKKCLINKNWIMHYLLLYHKKYEWYRWYIDNNKGLVLKKYLRRLSKVYWRLFLLKTG